jgi:hypothetical protein
MLGIGLAVQFQRMLRMPKALCLTGMVIAILLFALFLVDLVVRIPFGQASPLLDILFAISAAGLGYLSWSALRELN